VQASRFHTPKVGVNKKDTLVVEGSSGRGEKQNGGVLESVSDNNRRSAADDEKENANTADQQSKPSVTSSIESAMQAVSKEVTSINWYRTRTMVVWAVTFHAPAFILLYRFYDRTFRVHNLKTVSMRVFLTLIYSVPINAAFFTYGSWVNYTTDWWISRSAWFADKRVDVSGASESPMLLGMSAYRDSSAVDRPPPYDWEEMLATAERKLRAELVTTVTDSALFWVPANFANFAYVPSHLRPLAWMAFSIVWNCYLSLAQYRGVPDASTES